MRSAFSGASVVATCTARRAVSAATVGRQLGVRGETPGAVDDDPHRQADLAGDDRGLQFAVAQLDDLGGDAVNPQVGVAGAGGERRRQRGVGQLVPRQREEVGIDTRRAVTALTVMARFN